MDFGLGGSIALKGHTDVGGVNGGFPKLSHSFHSEFVGV